MIMTFIAVTNLKKIWEFYIFPNSQNMGAQFLSYTLDDPLGVRLACCVIFVLTFVLVLSILVSQPSSIRQNGSLHCRSICRIVSNRYNVRECIKRERNIHSYFSMCRNGNLSSLTIHKNLKCHYSIYVISRITSKSINYPSS